MLVWNNIEVFLLVIVVLQGCLALIIGTKINFLFIKFLFWLVKYLFV